MRINDWLSEFSSRVLSSRRPLRRSRSRLKNQRRANENPLSRTELLEPRIVLTGNLNGQIFNDLDGDGVFEPGDGETGAGSRTVFLDENGNGAFDGGEPTVMTAADGTYTFPNLADGTHEVGTITPVGTRQSAPVTHVDGQTVITVPGRIDHVYDATRDRLYIGTNRGTVEQYDIRTGQLLESIQVGVNNVAVDITADGQFLYVGEGQAGATESYIREVDLSDNSVRNIAYESPGLKSGTFDVNVTANDTVMFSSSFAGSGSTGLKEYIRATDTTVDRGSVTQQTRMKSNEDGSYFAMVLGNTSSGPVRYFEAATDTFVGTSTGTSMSGANVDINADGSILALEEVGGFLRLLDTQNSFAVLANTNLNYDAGIAFDPLRPLLYVGDSQNDELVAFNVPTLTEAFRIDLTFSPGRTYRPLTVSGEGDRVFINGSADEIVMFETIVPTTRSVMISGANVSNVDFGHRDQPNRVPVALDDEYSIGGSISVDASSGVLANDYDANSGQVISAQLVNGPLDGMLTLNPDGSFDYARGVGFSGFDSFTYEVTDGIGTSNVATVTLAGSPLPATTISGVVFDDANSNGIQDAGELGLSGQTVFLDANDDGVFQSMTETSQTTASDGTYTFTGVAEGTSIVALDVATGFIQTSPTSEIAGGGLFLDLPKAVDFVYDDVRGIEYITTNDGFLERFDIRSQTLLDPIRVGVSLSGIDITEDGQFAYIAETSAGLSRNFIRKVNLDDGSVTNLTYPRGGLESGVFDLTILNNGKAYFTSGFAGSGGVSIREIELATDTISVVTGVTQNSRMSRSADRSRFFLTQSNISSGPISYFDAATETFTASSSTSVFLGDSHSAVNADGSLIALEDNQHIGLSIMNEDLEVVGIVPSFRGGLAFDPNLPILYAGDNATETIVAFDTNTFRELYRFPIGQTIGTGRREMSMTSDGQFLFFATGASVRVYDAGEARARSVNVAGRPIAEVNFGTRQFTENTAPVGIDDFYTIGVAASITVPAVTGVLSNDVDPDAAQTLTATIESMPTRGTVTLLADGAFLYTKGPSFTSIDTFSYRIFDGSAQSAPVTVTVSTSPSGTSSVSGMKFVDLDDDGIFDPGDGEFGLPAVAVYVDINGNGTREAGEPSALTDGNGNYTISNLPAGPITVREDAPASSRQTSPVTVNGPGLAVPVTGIRDHVFDPTRRIVYMTASGGIIERFDVDAGTMLSSFSVGVNLRGIDIARDGSFLYVADDTEVMDQSFVRKVNPDTGAVTSLAFGTAGQQTGSVDVAVGNNGNAYVIGNFSGSGTVSFRRLDLATETFTTLVKINQNSNLEVSADGSLIFLQQSNSSSGPVSVFDVATETFDGFNTFSNVSSGNGAVSSDGSLIAFESSTFVGLSIFDSNLDTLEVLPRARSGLAFGPHGQKFYAADQATDELVVYSLADFQEITRVPVGEDVGTGRRKASTSIDGDLLFLIVGGGLRIFDIDVPSGYTIDPGTGESVTGLDFGNVITTPTLFAGPILDTIAEDDGVAATSLNIFRVAGDNSTPLTVMLSSSDTTEATVPMMVTILANEMSVTVPIDAIDDDFVDGTQTVTLTASATGFAASVGVLNVTDNEVAGFVIDESGGTTVVDESGTTDTFTVVLADRPLTDVVIDIFTPDPDELSLDKASLTFTQSNWDMPQTVTVTGEDDLVIDGIQSASIILSVNGGSNGLFTSLPNQTITATVTEQTLVATLGASSIQEDDGIQATSLTITRIGGVSTAALPFTINSNDTSEAIAPTMATIPMNEVSVTVLIDAVDDIFVDGTQSVILTASATDFVSGSVLLSVTDSEVAGVNVLQSAGTTEVDESGTTDSFTVALNAQPQNDVIVNLANGDTGEISVSDASLTFTPSDWDMPQTVTVTSEDDFILDGSQTATITLSVDAASDSFFTSLLDQTVDVTVTDDDVAGFVILESGASTVVTENLVGDSFDVLLTAQPVSDVVLTIQNPVPGELTASVSELTFTPVNWDSPQTVSITAIDDGVDEGPEDHTLTVAIDAGRSDDEFDAVSSQTVTVSIIELPSFDALGDLTIDEDDPQQSVMVTGIISGVVSNDTNLTATSNSTGLIPDPTVSHVLTSSSGILFFTPAADQNGEAIITVTAESAGPDGSLGTTGDNLTFSQSFTVTVRGVNDPPELTAPASLTVAEDGESFFGAATGNAISVFDLDAPTVQLSLSASNGVVALGPRSVGIAVLEGDRAGSRQLTILGSQSNLNRALNGLIYRPDADFTGSDMLNLTLSDRGASGIGSVETDSASVSITVTPLDDIPQNSVPGTQTTDEDTTLFFSVANGNPISVSDVDIGGGTLDVVLTATGATATLSTQAGLTVTGDGGSLVSLSGTQTSINQALDGLAFQPDAHVNGTATVTIATTDPGGGAGATDVDVVSVTVSPVNDAPVIVLPAGPVSTPEDTPLTLTGATAISISDVNDADQGTFLTQISASRGTLALSQTNGLTIETAGPSGQLIRFRGSVSDINAALEGMVLTTPNEFSGTVNITTIVNDLGNTGSGGVLLDSETLAVSVTTVNDPPVANPDTYFVRAGGTLSVSDASGNATGTTVDNGLLLNDVDPDTPALAVVSTTAPGSADFFTVNSSGTFIYRHNGAATLSDSFTYRVSDGNSDSDPATVTVNINHPPVAAATTALSISEFATDGATVGSVSATDLNPIDVLTWDIISGNSGGVFAIDSATGLITVPDTSLLDFETTPSYDLTITITDDAPAHVRSSIAVLAQITVVNQDEVLMVSPGDFSNNGITIRRAGGFIRVIRTGTDLDEVTPRRVSQISGIVVAGRASLDDELVVDFSAGNPIVGSLSYEGGSGGNDSLTLQGATFDTVTHSFVDGSSGSVSMAVGSSPTTSLSYTGLEPINDQLGATTRRFEFGSGDDDVTFSAGRVGNDGISRVSSVSSSETVDFVNPTGSLTIDLGAGSDSLLVSSSDSQFAAGVTFLGGAGADTINASSLQVAATIDGGDDADIITGGVNNDLINGGGGNDVLDGAHGNDQVIGDAGVDRIFGNLGNDFLLGGGGRDILNGGGGDDILFGNGSNDILSGGPGDDQLNGGAGRDRVLELRNTNWRLVTNRLLGKGDDQLISIEAATLIGGIGNNYFDARPFQPADLLGVTVLGGAGNDTMEGTAGNDIFIGGAGNDVARGYDGNDGLNGSSGADQLDGGRGNDRLKGQGGSNDLLIVSLGDDLLDGGAGSDRILANGNSDLTLTNTTLFGVGTDRLISIERATLNGDIDANRIDASGFTVAGGFVQIFGAGGDDVILGSQGIDLINGGDGDDLIFGNNGDDLLFGGAGNDGLSGGVGNDQISGQAGDDTGVGGAGDDFLSGGDGEDALVGGVGNDDIQGDGGQDFLAGGNGSTAESGDVITDSVLNTIDEVYDINVIAPWLNSV